MYLTDNSLDPELAQLARRVLAREAGDLPIVSVSQLPLDFGRNVCIGEAPRCWLSLFRAVLAGAEAVTTDWVAIAEHDCLYNHEHLHYRPDDPSVFHYNDNMWLVQWGGNHPELNGMYSWWPKRLALSQLVCRRDLLLESTAERVAIMEGGGDAGLFGHAEPGVTTPEAVSRAREIARSGSPAWLSPYLDKYLTRYTHKRFRTYMPLLDIRHATNFTGPRRGSRRRYTLPYWGRFENLIAGGWPGEGDRL